jgi:hypothetical protein
MTIHYSGTHIVPVAMPASAVRGQIYTGTSGKAVTMPVTYASYPRKIMDMSVIVRHGAPPFYL